MRYNLNFNVPLGVPIFGPPKKEWWPLIAAGVAAAGSLGGSALSYNQQKSLMSRQKEIDQDNMAYSQQLNKQYQNYLYHTQYGAQVRGMLNAGLNPAGANTSIGGMQGNSSLSTGGSSPASPKSDLGSSISEGAQVGIQAELAQSQKENIDADTAKKEKEAENISKDTAWKDFQNSPEYRKMVLQGMSSSSIKNLYDALKSSSDIDVNDVEIAKKSKEIDELSSKIDLNEHEKKRLDAVTAETYVSILEKFQGMSESQARIVYYRAAAKAQHALARKDNASASLDERRYELDTPWYEKENSIEDSLSKQSNRKRSDIGALSDEVALELNKYFAEVETMLPTEGRARLNFIRDAIHAISPVSDISK